METKKSKVWKVALIVMLVDLALIAISFLAYQRDQYAILGVGIVMCFVLFIQFVAGIIAAIREKSRQVGQGILLGSLVLLLVGLGICTLMIAAS